MMSKSAVSLMRLENWYIVFNRAYGDVYNNSRFEDGTFVKTSEIKSRDGDSITTANSIYKLGIEAKGL